MYSPVRGLYFAIATDGPDDAPPLKALGATSGAGTGTAVGGRCRSPGATPGGSGTSVAAGICAGGAGTAAGSVTCGAPGGLTGGVV